ncbi:MAG: Tat pathway signal protein [Planctomycetia bacterium]|nr:Tat pathway signal protein [Planctomycetia bacterium]
MATRRTFLKTSATLFAGAALSNFVSAQQEKAPLIWGNMLNLGHNMWGDTPRAYTPPHSKMICEYPVWERLTNEMADAGLNLLLIDLGEGVQYESHPEIAIEGAWSVEKLRNELARLRKMGIEPIPKLNFSACHDFWLGDYARMLSTPKYYEVCADLIQEVCEIFDTPRFFHLGYDEETFGHQQTYDYIVIRQNELWWHDFLFFVKTVDAQNVRPWIWSDYCWHHWDEFAKRMPKHVLQSNWYYNTEWDPAKVNYLQAYLKLEKEGFDQIPTGSNWDNDANFGNLVKFCREHIDGPRLKGFLQTPWKSTTADSLEHHLNAIRFVKEAKNG